MFYEWSGRNLPQTFDRTAAVFADNEALVAGERRLSYRELQSHVFQFAKGLQECGIGAGSTVAAILDNSYEFAVAVLALHRLGAVMVPLNLTWTAREFLQSFALTDPDALITLEEFRGNAVLQGLKDALPELLQGQPGTLTLEGAPTLRTVITVRARPTSYAQTFEEVFSLGANFDRDAMIALAGEVKPDDPVLYLPTSGSTGFPKPVIHTHQSLLNICASYCDALQFQSDSRMLNFGTTYHVSGQVLLNLPFVRGGVCVSLPWFDPIVALATIERERITHTWGFDVHFLMMRRSEAQGSYDISTLQSAIMGSDPSTFEEIAELGIPHHANVYGSSEYLCNLLPYVDRHDRERMHHSHGRPLEGVEQKIVNPATGERVPAGTIGEICVKGPGLFAGYYKMPEETAASFDDEGFFHTGDYAFMDDAGFTYFRGRLKDTVKTGGENVSAKEVELFLQTETPYVLMAQVFGVPDSKWGEAVTAVIELRSGVDVTEQELRDFCRGKLAGYKIPKRFIVIERDEWAITPTGKVDKQAMRRLTLERDAAVGAD